MGAAITEKGGEITQLINHLLYAMSFGRRKKVIICQKDKRDLACDRKCFSKTKNLSYFQKML